MALPGQKDNVVRDGSVSPGTSKRERSVSVIAGKNTRFKTIFSRLILNYFYLMSLLNKANQNIFTRPSAMY